MSFLTSNQTDAGGVLTPEVFEKAIAKLLERSDWEMANPHGLCAENPHIVGPRTRERLIREGGGWALCGTCGPCYIHV